MIAANYVTALMISTVTAVGAEIEEFSVFTVLLGLVTGCLYTGGMFMGMTTMGRKGASIAASVGQLSVIIPVGFSVVVFGESLRTNQLLGAGLAVVSLPLLASKPGKGNSMDRGTLMLLLATLGVQGFAQLSTKVLVEFGLSGERPVFFLAVFTAASLVTIPIGYRNRSRISSRDFIYGAIVGVCNIGGNTSILLALERLPGAIVFPLISSGGLLSVTILAWLVFKERVGKIAGIGILLTLLAVIVINLNF